MRYAVFVIVACALLLVSCTGSTKDDSVAGQLKSNQAVLLVLQNQGDLDHLYFRYAGDQTDASPNARVNGSLMIGELNMLIHNVGNSVTIGGLMVTGYDPKLIIIRDRLGQEMTSRGSPRNCYQNIYITATGTYDVALLCMPVNASSMTLGGRVQGTAAGGLQGLMLQLGNPQTGADWLATQIHNMFSSDDHSVNFFSNLGIFNQSTVQCNLNAVNGELSLPNIDCTLQFSNPAFDPSRASHGYLLVALQSALFRDPPYGVRPFPPRITLGTVLHGVSDDYPQGEAVYYDYDIWLNQSGWNPLLNDLKQSFQVTACYFYTTIVTPNVCVDPDPATNRNTGPCTLAPIIFKDPQGAPIKVTRIDQEARPGAISYTIYVEHVGGGQVWRPGAFDQCNPWTPVRVDRRKMDAIDLLDARVSGDLQQLTCMGRADDTITSSGPMKRTVIRLENGKGRITCVYPTTNSFSRSAYSTSLTLEFGYVYQNTIQKDVIIHRT